MPTLTRLLMTLLVLGGLAYGAMITLVTTVKPTQEELTIRIPTDRLRPATQ